MGDLEKTRTSESSVSISLADLSPDDAALAVCGYKQEFKRELGFFTSFGVSFSVLGLLPSIAETLVYSMGYAGTAGMTWGWLLAMIGIQAVALSMAELASSMPTSGGLYYAAAVLAPPRWAPLISFITGWSNWLGLLAGAPSVNYGNALMILAAASSVNPSYIPKTWHTYLISLSLMIMQASVASLPTRQVGRFNGFSTFINTLFLVIIIILIPAGTTNRNPRFNSSAKVWGTVTNGTEWPNGVAILLSFLAIIWTLAGFDAPFHLSEECSNAQIAVPRAIVATAATGGLFGWFFMLVMAYTVVDIQAAIASPIGQPFVSYCLQVLTQRAALTVTGMTIICSAVCGQGCMVALSRLTFAYSRDGCLPFSSFLATVNKRTQTPVNAVWFNAFIGCLLLLLMFADPVAIGAVFSVTAIAQYFAFTVPIFLRVFIVSDRFRPGPWNLGRFSRPIGAVAVGFVALMVPILCFPTVRGKDVTPLTMNWTAVVWGGPLLLAFTWFHVWAHKSFKGPVVNLKHRIHGLQPMTGQGQDEKVNDSGNEETTKEAPSPELVGSG